MCAKKKEKNLPFFWYVDIRIQIDARRGNVLTCRESDLWFGHNCVLPCRLLCCAALHHFFPYFLFHGVTEVEIAGHTGTGLGLNPADPSPDQPSPSLSQRER
jgi:hypothetical protein